MTLFEIIIICIVAALVVATIFIFYIALSYIRQLNITNKRVATLTNAAFECRSFLEKLSKHDVITKINKITDTEKKIGELISICKNQNNNITQVEDNLNKSLEDIKLRNTLIRDNHKLLDNINVKTSKMQDNINKIGEIVVDINKSSFVKYDKIVKDITYIREKLGEVSVDSEKEVINIDKMLKDILNVTKESNNTLNALIKGHNKGIDATRKAFEVVNDTLSNINDNINNVLKSNKISDTDIAKISSILNSYKEKINHISTYVESVTKLKTASKTKSTQAKNATTLIKKK